MSIARVNSIVDSAGGNNVSVAGKTFITSTDTIASNNNDTTIPTSAAVKAYADGVFDPATAAARIKTPRVVSPAVAQNQVFTGLGDYSGISFNVTARNASGTNRPDFRFQFSKDGGTTWSTAYVLESMMNTATVRQWYGYFDFATGQFVGLRPDDVTAYRVTTLSSADLSINAVRFSGSSLDITCVGILTLNGGIV